MKTINFLNYPIRKAQRVFKCFFCGKDINLGEKYIDGNTSQRKAHIACLKIKIDEEKRNKTQQEFEFEIIKQKTKISQKLVNIFIPSPKDELILTHYNLRKKITYLKWLFKERDRMQRIDSTRIVEIRELSNGFVGLWANDLSCDDIDFF